jgi:transposase-like protein
LLVALWKYVTAALRAIYRAKDAEAGMKALEAFEAGAWGQKSRHRAELAAQLGARRALLRLP